MGPELLKSNYLSFLDVALPDLANKNSESTR